MLRAAITLLLLSVVSASPEGAILDKKKYEPCDLAPLKENYCHATACEGYARVCTNFAEMNDPGREENAPTPAIAPPSTAAMETNATERLSPKTPEATSTKPSDCNAKYAYRIRAFLSFVYVLSVIYTVH
ncbi:hypothetical protein QR680_006491 [Steinernema hermaphroditum]|uniref:ShKT domain-containing protein n=1 Tax=Steinernema hermaphroditum TaxID=289476 RepID=A0AA39LXI7_9BILA|nr:hypothetical protein QR680_006491 [Steinernema hermaphroditum]